MVPSDPLRVGLEVPFKIFTARLGLSVRISQVHFQIIIFVNLSLTLFYGQYIRSYDLSTFFTFLAVDSTNTGTQLCLILAYGAPALEIPRFSEQKE